MKGNSGKLGTSGKFVGHDLISCVQTSLFLIGAVCSTTSSVWYHSVHKGFTYSRFNSF